MSEEGTTVFSREATIGPPLRVRKACALDREALREWVSRFKAYVELEGHAILTPSAAGPSAAKPSQYVILCDALRIGFAEVPQSGDPLSDGIVFIKPSAWHRVTQSQVLQAVVRYHRETEAKEAVS